MDILEFFLSLLVGLFSIVAVYYTFALFVKELADRDMFVTVIEDPTASVIMQNGRVINILMSQKGRDFVGRVAPKDVWADEADYWEIVDVPPTQTRTVPRWLRILRNPPPWLKSLNLLSGIRWLGFPGLAEKYKSKFSWASLEEKPKADGSLARIPHWKEEQLDYILLRFDLYVTSIEGAECLDKIPINGTILVGGRITNPFKALFRVEHWLEASLNLIGSRMRDFFASKSYAELLRIATISTNQTVTPIELGAEFNDVVTKIHTDWGFEISVIRLYSVEPGSDLAKQFIAASTEVYVAEQTAKAREAEGRGLIARDIDYFKQLAAIPGGIDLLKWQKFPPNLTSYAEGGSGAIPTIPMNTTPPPQLK